MEGSAGTQGIGTTDITWYYQEEIRFVHSSLIEQVRKCRATDMLIAGDLKIRISTTISIRVGCKTVFQINEVYASVLGRENTVIGIEIHS